MVAKTVKMEKETEKSTKKNSKDVKESQSGVEELGDGMSSIVKGTADSLFNCLAMGYEGIMSGVSKLSEKFGSKDPEVISNRQKLTKHHIDQLKKSFNNTKKSAWSVCKGLIHTTKGAIRTVFASGKDTINGLREDEIDKKTTKKTKIKKTGKVAKVKKKAA